MTSLLVASSKDTVWNHIHVQEIIEYLFHHVIGLANGNVVFLYKDTGNAFFLAEISHRFYFVLGDGTFIDYLFPDKAVSPVHGDISINQIPVLQFGEVVDNGFRTSVAINIFSPFARAASSASMVDDGSGEFQN